MVKKIGNLFMCEECLMKYEKRDLAEKCEKFCRENKSCNTELIKYAVK